jgi:hypothetical protein
VSSVARGGKKGEKNEKFSTSEKERKENHLSNN